HRASSSRNLISGVAVSASSSAEVRAPPPVGGGAPAVRLAERPATGIRFRRKARRAAPVASRSRRQRAPGRTNRESSRAVLAGTGRQKNRDRTGRVGGNAILYPARTGFCAESCI